MTDKITKILTGYTDMDTADMTRDSVLVADMELSSFDVVNVISEIEEEFGIEIPDKDIEDLITLGDIIDYVSEKTK